MMVKFTHYLVTRFNVPVKTWDRDKSGAPTLDDQWMQHRLSLFRVYCVPTIAGQTGKNFQWIIYCSTQTDSNYLKQIEAEVSTVPGAVIRLVEDIESMMADLRHLMKSATTPFVITSRVDNDDGLGKNYIRIIGEHFTETNKKLLNLTGGLLYDPDKKVMTQMKNSLKNHYTSLIEEQTSESEFLTVLGFPHDNPPAGVSIENIYGAGNWLKIIHERNLKSQLKGKPVFRVNKNYFEGIDFKHMPISIGNTVIYTFKRILHKF
jgi:hypothetical protein